MTDDHADTQSDHHRRQETQGLTEVRKRAQRLYHTNGHHAKERSRKVESLADLRRRAKRLYDVRRGLVHTVAQEDGDEIVRKGQESNKASELISKRSTPSEPPPLQFYSAYCHKASPTYFKWVNLTSQQIHTTLQIKEGYTHSWQTFSHQRDTPQLLFYQNHPIQFVQVVGVVVSVEEWFERFWLFTLDDSSGMTIDVLCPKPAKQDNRPLQLLGEDDEAEVEARQAAKLSAQIEADVEIGVVVQVKGTITLFQRLRQKTHKSFAPSGSKTAITDEPSDGPVRQITLARFTIVQDTNQELALVAARTRFHRDVLCKPWQLTRDEQKRLHKEALGHVEHEKKRAKARVEAGDKELEQEHADACTIAAAYQEEEAERLIEYAKFEAAGEALKKKLNATIPVDIETVPPLESLTKKKRKKRKPLTNPAAHASKDDSTMRFAPDDDEKSALLRAAFG